ncbi:MAG: hypothetical protein GX786_01915 [Clostridiales bacterium]|nr:hypothetical protein [Clostridiales bacterium]
MQWKRIFKSKGLYISFFLQLFALLYPHLGPAGYDIISYFRFGGENVFYYFQTSLIQGFELSSLFLPFIALLPAATLAAEDFSTGFIRQLLNRKGKSSYIRTRSLQASGAASLASAAAMILYLLFLLLVSPLEDLSPGSSRTFMIPHPTFGFLAKPLYGLPFIGELIVRTVFSAIIWSLVALAIGVLSKNTGITIALTFALHLSLVFFLEGALLGDTQAYSWSPRFLQLTNFDSTSPLSLWHFYAKLGVYFLLASGFSTIALHTQLKQIQ